MDLSSALDFILHVDDHLKEMIRNYGTTTYAILFGIIFAETGLVVTPFLPGDSLLFAAGVFCRPEADALNVWILFPLLTLAAILGDGVNYHIGKAFGEKLFRNEKSKIFKRSNLDKTHAFFEKYGGKTIVIARFVPIVRTFAPFVAGMGSMSYRKFLAYNVIGAIAWVGICVFAGYLFGGLSIVKNNFSLVALAIVALSVLPVIWEIVAHKRAKKKAAALISEESS